uniref:Cadherin domain-containing protein n=1 Tax=Timema douglasi TaxID=61478 RepID=A0A7R8ZA26_TIMDO|nr:unnamed protein product [Timema douglasi]
MDPILGPMFGSRIERNRYIDRPVGKLYLIVVAADLRGDTEYIQLSIRVTEYNRYPPIFTTSNYVFLNQHSSCESIAKGTGTGEMRLLGVDH